MTTINATVQAPSRLQIFGDLLKRDIVERRHKYLVELGKIAATTLFLSLMSVLTSSYGGNVAARSAREALVWYSIEFVIFSWYSASLMFADAGQKGGSIRFLMLPASQAEKFAVRWVIAVPLFFVAFMLCMMLAEAGRVLLMLAMGVPDVYYIWPISARAFDGETLLMIASYQSYFVLGAALWQRNSLGKTFCSLVVMLIIGIILAGATMKALGIHNFEFSQSKIMSMVDDETALQTAAYISTSLVLVINTTLAYLRIKDMDLK